MGAADINDPFTPDFSEFVNKALDDWKLAGISIAVVDGDAVFSKGYGYATLPDVPSTPETLWYGGSTTKAFVTATLAHLIETQKYPALSNGWQTRVSSIIRDDFVTQDDWATNNITLEDLACHRSGLRNNDMGIRLLDNGRPWEIRDIARNVRHLPLQWQPRTKFDYNNEGYATLSYVIEKVTGKWLGDVLKETIWNPLGMTSTYLDLQQAKEAPETLSTGYCWDDSRKKFTSIPFLPTEIVSGAGAIISNVTDYAKWIRCLLRKEGPLSKAVHNDIRIPRVVDNPESARGMDVSLYGLSWWRTSIRGRVIYWHSGSVVSHGALIYWLPEMDYGVVLLANYPNEVPVNERFDIEKDLRMAQRKREEAIAHAATTLFPNMPAKPNPPNVDINTLVGRYYSPGNGTFDFSRAKRKKGHSHIELLAERTDLLWKSRFTLRHASGNFWVMLISLLDDPLRLPDMFLGAEFRFGIDNSPNELVITFPTGDYNRDVILKRER
ncbi:hypothetical protein FLAG1_02361 [Fusarium langsethiae]|uniref:Beta-lactamase-related domain-containing protein n=1 Tax=Fusarium langsethiae TaxID=179993 RepID=A0A0M9F2M1_FUSLA|nr:hypothetical protein FLAG1_02361 [Fusarium langsethiae]GKU15517.1 unnamed protein product [Fusarium langsethiae]